MKLHLPGRRADAETPDASTDLTAQLVKTRGKGRPTPKRSEAQGRRQGPPPPPPTTRKEAYRRMRQTSGGSRGSTRAGGLRGGDLPARDRGPERKMVRDIVDSRRNVASLFLFVAVLMIAAEASRNAVLSSYVFAAWTAMFLLIIVDSFILGRRITRGLHERFPDTQERTRSLVWYGISRATMIRRWRYPKADPAVVHPEKAGTSA